MLPCRHGRTSLLLSIVRLSRARRPSVGMRTQGMDVKYPLERFAKSAYKYILRRLMHITVPFIFPLLRTSDASNTQTVRVLRTCLITVNRS